MHFEHYSQMITSSKRFTWYISSSGMIYKLSNKTNKFYQLHGTIKENDLVFKIKGKTYLAKNLAASKFLKDYYPGCCVGLKDTDIKNFNVENLNIYSMSEHGKQTGYLSRSTRVVVKEYKQEPITFRSVRDAAKYLYCSYQTLLDYLSNNPPKKSVLKKYRRKIYYLESGHSHEDDKNT